MENHKDSVETNPDFMSVNQDEIQGLLSLLDLSRGFTIAFAECNFWQDGVALADALSEAITLDPEWEELQLQVWEFEQPDLRYLLDELVKRLETLPIASGKKLVLVLRGLENAIGVVGDYPPFLADLNFVRDAYTRMVPHPVVFVLPDYALTRVANFAPDFWAWRSGVFKFKTTQETRNFAEAKTIGSERILGNYLKPEKQERIDLLHRLLMEYSHSGIDPKSNPSASTQITILIELGSAYYSLSEFNRAVEFYDQALDIAQKSEDRSGEASSLGNLGNAHNSLSHYQQAMQQHHQSLAIFQELGDRKGEANSLNNLGIDYRTIEQYHQAIYFHNQALEIFRKIRDRNGEANSLNNLGVDYRYQSDYQQSIQFNQQALKIFQEIDDFNGEASSLIDLGNDYRSLGDHQQASHYYQQSLKIAKKIGDRHSEANSLGNLGNTYDSLGQYQQAIHFYQQSLEIAKTIGDRHGEANSLNNLGLTLKKLDRSSEALKVLRSSRQIYEELGLYNMVEGVDKAIVRLSIKE